MKELITILGPTASGKTLLAAALARAVDGEILSADSRQVYRGMDIGTGKDLADYGGVPYHLIDICAPGEKYNLFRYQEDFKLALEGIQRRGKQPILCGGTGLYIESVLRNYNLPRVPQNAALRAELEGKPLAELTLILKELKRKNGAALHNTTDIDNERRAIRAIEIETWIAENSSSYNDKPNVSSGDNSSNNYLVSENNQDSSSYNYLVSEGNQGNSSNNYLISKSPAAGPRLVFGIEVSREERRKRISLRLKARLDGGLVEEVRRLLDEGIAADDLIYYGLEYKFVTEYCIGRRSFDDMFQSLEIAIHQFAKRQMTWFRGMERRGTKIRWLDGSLPLEEKVAAITSALP
ncbi:MAG: tRNA (adenosine(37)-N6)-dimethylallyltransferase MiaA [Prevotella sp.]|nr:tRNA (adenosine(37)-N6)-dimethylallyltransferase MiaA [Prevotella sp.]